MGLTKQYLAYRAIDNFNIINSGRPNVNFVVFNNIEGKFLKCDLKLFFFIFICKITFLYLS